MTSTAASQHHGDEGKGALERRGCLDPSSLLCKFSARLTLNAGDLVRTQYMPHDIFARVRVWLITWHNPVRNKCIHIVLHLKYLLVFRVYH